MKAIKKAMSGSKMKTPMYNKGGKLKMVKGPDGNMVPFYAADGKGKAKHGAKVKAIMKKISSMKKAKHGSKVKVAGKGAYMKK